MYESLGGIAGGLLGYIHNNTKGAVAGYKLGKTLGKRFSKKKLMAPIPRGTKRKAPNSFKSKAVSKVPRMGDRNVRTFKSNVKRRPKGRVSGPRNSTTVGKSKKYNKKVHYKKHVKTKVSRKLRAKIEKVISGRDYPGFYHSVFYGTQVVPAQNTQAVFPLLADNLQQYHFSPQQILNAASVLWNGKPVPVAGPFIGDVFNFDPKQTTVYVRKSWAVHQLKNNTQRTLYLKMFNCRPKNDQNGFDAIGQWVSCLAEMAGSGAGGLYSENPLGTAVTTLHSDPRGLKGFSKWWTTEVTQYTMDPGQVVDYVVQGPSDVKYDFSKYYDGTTYMPVQKIGRFVFGVLYGDLTYGTLAGAARGVGNSVLNSLAWESNAYYAMDMPDKAGIVGVGIAGLGTQLQERHNAYSIYVNQPLIGAAFGRVDEENPALETYS